MHGLIPRVFWLLLATVALGADGDSDAETAPAPGSVMTETVTVTATRLSSEPEVVGEVPAQVTIIERDQIERSGVRTLQDLLSLESGVVLYDQVGNDIQKTLDLRGFSEGSGTKVFLDGAPLNDTRNNHVALDLVPLAALERIEISRGSAAALAGGGSEAGVIHLLTRHGDEFGGSLSLSGGTFDTTDVAGELHGGAGRFDFFISGSDHDSDGFRENSGGDVTRLAGTLGADLGGDRRLALSLVDSTSDLGNPGALTAEELSLDPGGTPFNNLDFSEEELSQATLNFRGPITDAISLAVNVFVRDRESEVLSTGRSAAFFGGFFLDSDASAAGSTVQLTHDVGSDRRSNRLIAGVEWLRGETDALGYFTPPADLATVDRTAPASNNTTERRSYAFYVQDLWSPLRDWTFLVGARADNDRVEYDDAFDPALADSRRFSEISLRAGANWQASEKHELYVSYGEGFLPPTVEELFSFPLFFSNPDLDPEDSRSYELGYRSRPSQDARLDVSLFQIDTRDEIIFVPDPGSFFTGANENVGETRRLGIEAAFHVRPVERVRLFANLTLVDSEFRTGPNDGNEVPLVPGERFAAGVDIDLPAEVTLRVEGLFVGEQTLGNDQGNLQDELDDYSVVNTRATWTVAGFRLFAEARNLFDEEYATRAAYFGETFFTPAPGRRYLGGVTWLF